VCLTGTKAHRDRSRSRIPIGASVAESGSVATQTQDKIVAKVTKTFQYGNHQVTLETGEIARQASGAVIVRIDDTVVLCHGSRRQVGA
jgi:hypothetical protein